MYPVTRVRSTTAMEILTHKHSFFTPTQYFRFQVDLQINLTVRRSPGGYEAETTTSRFFHMWLFVDPAAEARISHILGLVGAPAEHRPCIARQIVRKGRRVVGSFRHVDHGWAHMIANVEIDYFYFRVFLPAAALERAMVQRALAASAREAGDGMVPASEEAVRRSLKRVRVETGGGPKKISRTTTTATTTYSICLEDIESCGTSMPCSHVFHEGCIVKWLRQSHYCPLCRFEIPTESTQIATELY